MKNIFLFLTTSAETTTFELTNPLVDENGNLITAEEAVSKFDKFWKNFDIVSKLETFIPKLIIAVILIIVGFQLAKILSKLVIKAMERQRVDPSVYNFISNFLKAAVKICFVLTALSLFININSVIAAIGALFVTAGIGLKDSVAQFASGIQILFNHPFVSGDYVSVDGTEGSVTDIRFMYTVLTTTDNKRVTIPNSHITSGIIINYSSEDKRRLDLPFVVAFDADIIKAKEIINDIIKSCEDIQADPEPACVINSQKDNGVEIVAKVWTESTKYWDVYYLLQQEIRLALTKADIETPSMGINVKAQSK